MNSGNINTLSLKQAIHSLKSLPVAFMPNAGQTHSRVLYHTHGMNIFVTKEEIVFLLRQTPQPTPPVEQLRHFPHLSLGTETGHHPSTKDEAVQNVALSLRFLNASPDVRIDSRNPGNHVVNFFHGDNPDKWYTNLPTYSEVVYRNLWTGIDLVLKGANGRLKYEFFVQPGARIDDIRLAYLGADDLSLDAKGNLEIHTPLGNLLDERPVSYQEINGNKVPLESHFSISTDETGETTHGFKISPDYHPEYPILIDPGLAYSTYLGGSNSDAGLAIAIDEIGNAYVTGITSSTDFPTSMGAYQADLHGLFDAFVTKLNPTGSGIVYSTYLGGNSNEQGMGIAVNAFGNALVAGVTQSTDFPTTESAYQRDFHGSEDVFVTKLDVTGSALVYSTYLGGNSNDVGLGIAVDALDNAYVTGYTRSENFPTSVGAYQTSLRGVQNAFITKLNSTGSNVFYSTYLGGSIADEGNGITIDAVGNAYVTGDTGSVDFPTTSDAYQTSYQGGFGDAFVTKLNPTGSNLVYSTYLGGSGLDYGNGIAVDSSDNAYITGYTRSTNFPTTLDAYQRDLRGYQDVIVTKLDATGSNLVYSTYLGGSDSDYGNGIAVDTSGNAYLTGYTYSADFPVTPGAFQTSLRGYENVFVTKLDITGSHLVYSTYLGGSIVDEGYGITVDASEHAYVTGSTYSEDFPITEGAYQTFSGGGIDVFVSKLDLVPVLEADLAITVLASPSPVTLGQELIYTLTASNLGPDTATEVTVIDTLPSSVDFVSAYSTQGSCSESEGIVICDLDTLTYGASATITITVRPTAVGTIHNEAGIGGQEIDPNPDNNRASVDTEVLAVPLTSIFENKMVVDFRLKILQTQPISTPTTPAMELKVPVVLAEPTLHISIDDSFVLPIPSAEIKSVENRVKLVECLLALPSNVLFVKGFIRKNIQYVMRGAPRLAPETATVSDYTMDIPFGCTTDLTGRYLNPPLLPSMNTQVEFEFFTSTLLPASFPHSSKDHLLAGDLTQLGQQRQEFFNELPYCELLFAQFADYLEAPRATGV